MERIRMRTSGLRVRRQRGAERIRRPCGVNGKTGTVLTPFRPAKEGPHSASPPRIRVHHGPCTARRRGKRWTPAEAEPLRGSPFPSAFSA